MKYPWIVYYSDQEKSEAFLPYNPIIFDSDAHPPLQGLLYQHKEILGYISLGEVEENRSWFKQIKEASILLRENPNWHGSWLIDIRNPFWKQFLLNEIIPKVFAQGFTGLFFDQVDASLALEQEDSIKYKGMHAAAIDLIQTIRKHFPGKKIMMNRGYEILLSIGNSIDYELAESLYTSYDFAQKKYYVRTQEEYEWQMKYLDSARKIFPHLVVFSLDYWPYEDIEMYKKIYSIERSHCLRPYVTILSLNQISKEP